MSLLKRSIHSVNIKDRLITSILGRIETQKVPRYMCRITRVAKF